MRSRPTSSQEPTSLTKFELDAANPSATTATLARCTRHFFFASSTPRNITEREPNTTSLIKTRRVIAESFARADGSRGVHIACAIDARGGNVLDAVMAAASAPLTSGSARSARARHSTLPLSALISRDNLRIADLRQHAAARSGTRSPRETAFSSLIYFLARFFGYKMVCPRSSFSAIKVSTPTSLTRTLS